MNHATRDGGHNSDGNSFHGSQGICKSIAVQEHGRECQDCPNTGLTHANKPQVGRILTRMA